MYNLGVRKWLWGRALGELIDIYDAGLRHLGTAERSEVHRLALWHRTFHLWVVSTVGGGSLLFQLRSINTENFPGLFDVSAAGHLLAGESVGDGLREASEELGVSIPAASVSYLGQRIEVVDRDGGYRDREFQSVHMVQLDEPLSRFDPQVSEVSGLVWIGLGAAVRLFSSRSGRETARGVRFDAASGVWVPFQPRLGPGEFVPRLDGYYLAVCIMAERLLEGRSPLAI